MPLHIKSCILPHSRRASNYNTNNCLGLDIIKEFIMTVGEKMANIILCCTLSYDTFVTSTISLYWYSCLSFNIYEYDYNVKC